MNFSALTVVASSVTVSTWRHATTPNVAAKELASGPGTGGGPGRVMTWLPALWRCRLCRILDPGVRDLDVVDLLAEDESIKPLVVGTLGNTR